MNLIKQVVLTLTANLVAKSDDQTLQAENGLKTDVDFINNTITIRRTGKSFMELLPYKILNPNCNELFEIRSRTESELVIGLKDELKDNALAIYTLEDVIEFILTMEDGFTVMEIEFIPAKELPFTPSSVKKK